MKTLKQRLSAGEMTRVFAMGRVVHPIVIEMFGLAGGYHGFWLDQEHASISTEQIVTVSLAGRANDLDCFVRIPPIGYWQVTQCLEAGAGGVMAAQIHSAEQAAEFIRWCRFAPLGTRGFNMSGRDADYTYKPAVRFAEDSNRERLFGIQVETLGAVEAAGEIAALDGCDLLFIGPADLSLALGIVGQFHHDKLWEAISRVADACKRYGKSWGCVAPDPAFADRAVEMGRRMPTFGNDIVILRRGIEAVKGAFASQFEVT
ncbi:MAG: host specificity protein [Planctomycetales bacterium]|nr:host specificity protein [Planctomycetales bacterium]